MKPRGWIYIVQIEGDGPVKIGFSYDNPMQRVYAVWQGCPLEIKWLACFRSSRPAEQKLLMKFAQHKIRGEWFKPATEIIEYVKGITNNHVPTISELAELKKEVASLIGIGNNKIRGRFLACMDDSGIDRAWLACRPPLGAPPTPKEVAAMREAVRLYRVRWVGETRAAKHDVAVTNK